MASTLEVKKAVLDFFSNKVGGDYFTRGVPTIEFHMLVHMGFDKDDVFDSLEELVKDEVLRDGGRAIMAGKNYLK